MILQRNFYNWDSALVARELIGKKIVRRLNGINLIGIISDVEAYYGANDSASHASKGKTTRNSVMFGPPGFSYVYFIYGKHHMFNIVTQRQGRAGAVLVRGLVPMAGIEEMIKSRNGQVKHIADGPAKLCQALQIDGRMNRIDLTRGEQIWLEKGQEIDATRIRTGPRIGIDYAEEKDVIAHLRFWLEKNRIP